MKTREKILHTALELFNRYGVPNVTLRRIAAEMNISQGNLNYYFKKREDIIEALYYQLLEVFNEEKGKLDTEKMDMRFVFDSTRAGMEALFRYRFLMIDFNQNMRENPKLHAQFKQLEEIRKVTYLKSFEMAIAAGIMRLPAYPGEYEGLNERIRVFSDYWIASAEVYGELSLEQESPGRTAAKYHKLLVETFFAYFTPQAQQDFVALLSQGTEGIS
jgi:AcrR family transcriptional regulator